MSCVCILFLLEILHKSLTLQVLSQNGPSDAVDNDSQISFPSFEDEAHCVRPFADNEKFIPVKVNCYSTI